MYGFPTSEDASSAMLPKFMSKYALRTMGAYVRMSSRTRQSPLTEGHAKYYVIGICRRLRLEGADTRLLSLLVRGGKDVIQDDIKWVDGIRCASQFYGDVQLDVARKHPYRRRGSWYRRKIRSLDICIYCICYCPFSNVKTHPQQGNRKTYLGTWDNVYTELNTAFSWVPFVPLKGFPLAPTIPPSSRRTIQF